MKLLSFILSICLCSLLSAQKYNVALINDSLRENASAITRYEELKVVIKSTSKAVITHKWAITILNESGEQYAGYSSTYSKMFALNSVDGNLYDALGKQLKSVKRKDLADESYDDQMTFVTDDRLKKHNFYYRNYPYTVEYEEETEYDGIFFLPAWQPVTDEKYSVQQSSFIVETPVGYNLRYKQINTPQVVVTKTAKSEIYQWQINNVKAMKEERYQPDWKEVTPCVYIAPTDFEFGGYKGNMSSWQSLGKYINSLYAGRDNLPANIKQQVHQIADNVADKKEKIKLLYQFMQQNTRYIGIQLGIGGWQPFDASYVATKHYGDCKALTNYMVSILKEAGLNAHAVIIKAGGGKKGLWEDFPAPYFNHVVMCVPDGKDTTWLECTSQTLSAGYMGSSTGNRKALFLADDGGHVVNTPRYGIAENLQIRRVDAIVDTDGNLTAEVNTRFTGEQQELQHSLIYSVNKKEREEYLNRVLNLPTYKIEKSAYTEEKGYVPVIKEYIKVVAPGYASITGKRLFITPNLFNRSVTNLSLDEPRKFDIEFDYAFKDEDTIFITVPVGYEAEALPKNIDIQSKFGKYSITYAITGNKIELIRKYETDAKRYPGKDYVELAAFFDQKYKADRARIVMVKKEG